MNPIKWSNESLLHFTFFIHCYLPTHLQFRWWWFGSAQDEKTFPQNFLNQLLLPLIVRCDCPMISLIVIIIIGPHNHHHRHSTDGRTIIIKCGNQKRTCQFPPGEREIESHHQYKSSSSSGRGGEGRICWIESWDRTGHHPAETSFKILSSPECYSSGNCVVFFWIVMMLMMREEEPSWTLAWTSVVWFKWVSKFLEG